MEKKQLENEIKQQKNVDEKEQLTKEILKYGGLWSNIEEMDFNLEKFHKEKLKIDSIKCQIRYRKKVLDQKFSNKKLCQVGESDDKGKYKFYGLDTLRINLCAILNFTEQMFYIKFDKI